MIRKIDVDAGAVKVTARIKTPKHNPLTRDEVELVRDELADALQDACSNLRYIGIPRNRIKVK